MKIPALAQYVCTFYVCMSLKQVGDGCEDESMDERSMYVRYETHGRTEREGGEGGAPGTRVA